MNKHQITRHYRAVKRLTAKFLRSGEYVTPGKRREMVNAITRHRGKLIAADHDIRQKAGI